MACLFNVDLNNNGQDKVSQTHEKFISLYGTDENGLNQAKAAYLQMFTPAFKKDLGLDFEVVQEEFRKNPGEGFIYNDNVLNEQLEPELHTNKYGQAWFIREDGSKKWIDGKPFSNINNTYFTESMIRELTDYTLYNALGGLDNLINVDFENDIDFVIDRALGKDTDFRKWLETSGFSERDINELIVRVRAQMINKGFKLKDNDDLIVDQENEPDEEIEFTDEEFVEDINQNNEVVKKESYLSNSKDTASANVKLLLSLVPKLESYQKVQLADGTIDYELELATGELGMVVFEDLNDVWSDLENILSGIFTLNDGGNFVSAKDQMKAQITELAKDKPSIGFILKYLNDAENQGKDYKINQFIQAFTKKKLMFFTTEVEGKTAGTYNYKVFDAASATSVQASLRNTWSNTLESLASDEMIFGKTKEGFKINQDVLKAKRKAVGEIKTRLQKKGETLTSEDKQTVTDFLNNVGIFPSEKGMSKVLRQIHEETSEGEEFNETKAYKTLIQGELGVLAKLFDDQTKNIGNLTAKDGSFINPFKSNKLTQRFAKAETTFQNGFTESTVMLPGSKMAWSFSLPSYIDLRINELINSQEVRDALRALPYNKRSLWLKEIEDNPNLLGEIKTAVFAALQQQNQSVRGADNKNIEYLDQLSDQINKSLKGILPNEKPIFYTPAPADKGRFVNIQGFGMKRLPLSFTQNEMSISPESEGVSVLTGYFEDELDRMISVWNDIKSPNSKKYVHYHLIKGKDQDGNFQWISERDGIPQGNGFKSQLFPSINASTHEQMLSVNEELDFILYNTDKDSASYAKPIGLTEENRTKIKKYIAGKVLEKTKETVTELENDGVFVRNQSNVLTNNTIDSRIFKQYLGETKNINNAIHQIVADYLINGYISNTEYSKLFSGDPAFYKDSVDYNKRIPATYTDGKTLVGIQNQKDSKFNIAVVNGIEISALNLKEFKSNFIKSLKAQRKLIKDKELLKTLSDDKIEKTADSFVKQYESVNTTDAQAWITLDRWKFLKTHLDGWNPSLEKAYQRLKSGEFNIEDLKHAAQPLKGVYFNQDHKNGVPTYLKYSQAVLIPALTKNTQLDKVREAMEKQGIDELITLDGVKSGALVTTIINDLEGNVLEDLKFNIQTLDNLKWKLQQQLPVKGLKESADLGSQMQKNIISNIFKEAVYGELNGEELTGEKVVEIVNKVTAQLTDIGFQNAIKRLGSDQEGNITDKEALYDSLIKEAQSKQMPSNIIEALQRGYSLDAIPQVRYKAENIISAILKDEVVKTKTPGGALIQVSNFGLDKIGVSKEDVQSGGIYMLKDIEYLKRPEMKVEGDKTIVTPGQVFLPHGFIQKHIPNYKKLSREKLLKKIDPKLLTLIGYRIPNQKLSSNQPLEVVGILPEGMGDSIVMYSEITMQTGSDFDIDKTYVMMPAFEVDENKNIKYVEPIKEPKTKKQLQNTLYEVYWQVLTSPLSYFDMMSGIDGSQLKDTINDLHGKKEQLSDLELASPLYQMRIKFDNMTGKSGVGLTANQMVDHVYTQMYNISQNYELGIGNLTEEGNIDLSGIFDTDGNKITDSISMFLNAFVDIAKDPYITKGNFNTVTSNISFLLLRAGVPLDFVIKYIGQPSFKTLVKKIQDNKSKLGESRRNDFKQFIKELKGELKRELQNENILALDGIRTIVDEAYNKNKNLKTINKDDLVSFIKDDLISPEQKAKYYGGQIGLLESIEDLYDPSEQLAAQVLVSKADVNGGGPDIVTHFIQEQRFLKIMNENNFEGLDRKFAEDTILGAKTDKSLMFLSQFDENNFITMHPMFKNVYVNLTKAIKKLDFATDKNVVKEVEKGAYAAMVSSALDGTAYGFNKIGLQDMFFGNNTVHDKVAKAKKHEDTKDNPLIKAFDLRVAKDKIKYITLDNFLNRPSSSNEDLTKSWEELFDTNRSLAIDLVRYSIASSGFSKNRHSFYDLLPIRVSDLINNGLDRIRFRGEIDQATFENFMTDFLRHERNPDQKLVPSISAQRFTELKKNVKLETVSTLKKALPDLFKNIGTLAGNDIVLIGTDLSQDANVDSISDLESIINNKIIKIGTNIYENHGKIVLELSDQTGSPVYVEKVLLTKTHRLGYYNNGTYIYEYGQASSTSLESDNKSSLELNNPNNYEGIKEVKNRLVDSDVTLSYTPFVYDFGNNLNMNTRRKKSDSTDLENDGTIKNRC